MAEALFDDPRDRASDSKPILFLKKDWEGGGGQKPGDHDLMELYEEAVRRGLRRNDLVLTELPLLSDLHKTHYARYPKIEALAVPASISGYDDRVEQLFRDIGNAFGETLGWPRRAKTN